MLTRPSPDGSPRFLGRYGTRHQKDPKHEDAEHQGRADSAANLNVDTQQRDEKEPPESAADEPTAEQWPPRVLKANVLRAKHGVEDGGLDNGGNGT